MEEYKDGMLSNVDFNNINKHRFFEEICLNSGNLQKEHLAIPFVS